MVWPGATWPALGVTEYNLMRFVLILKMTWLEERFWMRNSLLTRRFLATHPGKAKRTEKRERECVCVCVWARHAQEKG